MLCSEGACIHTICFAEMGKFENRDIEGDELMNVLQKTGLFLPLVLLNDSEQVTCTNLSWVVTNDVILLFWLTQLRYSEAVLKTQRCSKSQ